MLTSFFVGSSLLLANHLSGATYFITGLFQLIASSLRLLGGWPSLFAPRLYLFTLWLHLLDARPSLLAPTEDLLVPSLHLLAPALHLLSGYPHFRWGLERFQVAFWNI